MRKEFTPSGSFFFFPLRVDPFYEGGWYDEKANRKSKMCLPSENWRLNLQDSPFTLKSRWAFTSL